MQEPDCVDIEVFVGVDVAKGDHYACAVTAAGIEVLARGVRNDEASVGRLIDDAAVHGAVALVIDTTSSAASLLLETAARREVPVAYVTGRAMRRAADLYAGAAKTDPKDAAVLADYARRNADRLTWTAPSDELLVRLRILNGRDADLAADATRAANRLRDALLAVSPALERALGDKLAISGGARDTLVRWGTPTALRSAGRARIRTRIAKRSPRTADRLTDAISAALDAQSITVTAEATWGDTITELATDLDRICGRRDQLAGDIEAAFMEHPLGKSSPACAGSAREPEPGPSLRSATPTASPTAAASPPTPGSPPSTGNQGAAPSPANPEAATTASRTPCSPQPSSPPSTTQTPAPTTSANAQKANATTPPSSASPDAAATSSSPCSRPKPPTNHPNLRTCPKPPRKT